MEWTRLLLHAQIVMRLMPPSAWTLECLVKHHSGIDGNNFGILKLPPSPRSNDVYQDSVGMWGLYQVLSNRDFMMFRHSSGPWRGRFCAFFRDHFASITHWHEDWDPTKQKLSFIPMLHFLAWFITTTFWRWFPLSLRPQNPPARWLSITLMWNLGWLPQLQKQDSPIQGLSPIIWLPFASFLMARVWNPEEPSVLEVVIFKKDSSSRRDKPDRP